MSILVFAILISIPLIIPYLHPGFFQTHDGYWWVIRLADMFRELKDLQFPPRYSEYLNSGYGYPLFNFTYPFPFYIGVLVKLLGFGFVDSIKVLFAASVPISAFFMFLASRNIWKNDFAGIISSVLYLYFPYRLVDLFVRGSIGEALAFAIMPAVFLSLSKLIDDPKNYKYKLLGVFSYAILILTHNIIAVLFTISLFIFFIGNFIQHLFNWKKGAGFIRKKYSIVKSFSFIIVFGFLISAYFWIPAILEKQFVRLSNVPIANRSINFISINDLLFSPWGYDATRGDSNPFTLQIGWPFLLIIISTLGLILYTYMKRKIKTDLYYLALTLLIGTLIFSFLVFKQSNFIWQLPILSDVTFPWIVLSQLGLLISLLAGFLAKFKITKYAAMGILFLALFLYIPWAKPLRYEDKGDGFYYTNDDTTTTSKELMPLWVKKIPTERPASKVEIVKGKGKIENVFYNSKTISFDANLEMDTIVRINTIYYPGWKVSVNNQNKEISYQNEKGVMEIRLPKGRSRVKATFTETPQRMISNIISVLSLIVLFGLVATSLLKIKK